MNELRLEIYRKKIIKFIEAVFLILFAFIQVYPFIWLLLFSLKSNSEIFGGNIAGFPEKLLWENYKTAAINGKVLLYFFNSANASSRVGTSVLIGFPPHR